MQKTVLFLCTGNYYRSRFAEHYFNARAQAAGAVWRADSRGLATELGTRNVGPISPYTVQALSTFDIAPADPERSPQQVNDGDFSSADLIVALKEAEHRLLLAERHPAWVDRVTYWHIHDLDMAPASQALEEIASAVDALLETLNPA